MNKRISFLLLCGMSFLYSCRKDVPPKRPEGNVTLGQGGGVFVLNEGNFMFGNAKVSYHSKTDGTTVVDLYNQTNGFALGDVLQSMYVANGRAYLVVNNSSKIEVCRASDLKRIGTINGINSPRYFLPVSNNKAYVSDIYANKIWIVDLATNTVSGQIVLSGWTEQMVLMYGKVFVTNYEKDQLYIIDSKSDQLVDSIGITYGANSIKQDNQGKLWVLCSGKPTAPVPVMPALYRIDPVSRSVEQNITLAGTPSRLCTNGTYDTLYFLNSGVYRFTSAGAGITSTPVVEQGLHNFYGLGIDPRSGELYIADAIDYIQAGNVLIYKPNGTYKTQFAAGIIPADFWFEQE